MGHRRTNGSAACTLLRLSLCALPQEDELGEGALLCSILGTDNTLMTTVIKSEWSGSSNGL